MLILISDAFDDKLPKTLGKYGEVTDDHARQAEAEVILIRSKTKVTKEYIDASPKLKLVIRGGVGLDNVDQVYAREKGIAVHNTADASSVAVAELAFALMIALPNHIVRADATMREKTWAKKELKRTELLGKTLLVLGMGRIGSALAARAKAFGMKVLGYDPYVYFTDAAEMRSDVDAALGEADYISMHMPLLPATKEFINKDRIAKMKDGVFIVNTGRGKCINEADMAEALKSGKIAGFGNDVWYSDPPEWDTPLLSAPNCLFAPHIGASTKENMGRIGVIAEQIIATYKAAK
ncbi:MAG: hydroxyacid dehydrogenase [candidate division Zixibacteria bacterium]|nr:hydroxyacid dehydrogenase [candidate division Zixibacteria bacterium]